MKIFSKTNLNLDELAVTFREILNIPPTNRSQIVQAQDGLNIGGGLYYYFEIFGLKLYFIRNSGEVAHPEKGEFQFIVTWKIATAFMKIWMGLQIILPKFSKKRVSKLKLTKLMNDFLSQRDEINQPSVARNELRWVVVQKFHQP